jgi:hypothetical protein
VELRSRSSPPGWKEVIRTDAELTDWGGRRSIVLAGGDRAFEQNKACFP